MPLDDDEYQKIFNEGEQDAKEGRCEALNGPWGSIFDKEGEWEEKNDAYQAGRENHESQSSESSGGGCFFTSACVSHAGLKDDCEELTVLRHFRDTYLSGLPEGMHMIQTYYREAPEILRAVYSSANGPKELERMYEEIQPIVADIKAGSFETAVVLYKNMFERLRAAHQPSQQARI